MSRETRQLGFKRGVDMELRSLIIAVLLLRPVFVDAFTAPQFVGKPVALRLRPRSVALASIAAADETAALPPPSDDDEPFLRCGHGYDIHRMAPRAECPDGQPLVIGGVRFDGSEGHAADFELGCVAHSDGDVSGHTAKQRARPR